MVRASFAVTGARKCEGDGGGDVGGASARVGGGGVGRGGDRRVRHAGEADAFVQDAGLLERSGAAAAA